LVIASFTVLAVFIFFWKNNKNIEIMERVNISEGIITANAKKQKLNKHMFSLNKPVFTTTKKAIIKKKKIYFSYGNGN